MSISTNVLIVVTGGSVGWKTTVLEPQLWVSAGTYFYSRKLHHLSWTALSSQGLWQTEPLPHWLSGAGEHRDSLAKLATLETLFHHFAYTVTVTLVRHGTSLILPDANTSRGQNGGYEAETLDAGGRFSD